MCYLDMADTLSVNKKFARITNTIVAVYFAQLLVIMKEVQRKNKFDPLTGLWKLDRKYVFSETGINTDEQKAADETLFKLGIITKIDPTNRDRIAIDTKRYFEILTNSDLIPEDLLPKTAKMSAADRKAAKHEAIISGIVNLFEETDPDALTAITNLVDVYYGKGVCKHQQWSPIIKTLRTCTTDPAGTVEIVNYILSTNYTSIPAAIDSFMKKHAPTATKLNNEQKSCTGTMPDITF